MSRGELNWEVLRPGLLHTAEFEWGVFHLARVPGKVLYVDGVGPRFRPEGGWAPRYYAEELLEGWELHMSTKTGYVYTFEHDTWQQGRRRAEEAAAECMLWNGSSEL